MWNASSRIQGQADPALSDEGVEQSRMLGQRMRDARISRIYSSDLERARLTAEAVAEAGPVPILDPRLREVSLGEWEGATSAELERSYPELFKAWVERPSWDLVPGGEGEDAFEARVFAAMTDIIGAAGEDDTVAVVTHIGVIRLLLSAIAGTQLENMRWRWAIHNTSISSIESRPDFGAWRAGDVDVVAINDTAHMKMVSV